MTFITMNNPNSAASVIHVLVMFVVAGSAVSPNWRDSQQQQHRPNTIAQELLIDEVACGGRFEEGSILSRRRMMLVLAVPVTCRRARNASCRIPG